MLTGKIKNQIDDVWLAFHSGGIANPISVIEQITYLIFIRRLDQIQTTKEAAIAFTGGEVQNPVFTAEEKHLRWDSFKNKDPEQMLTIVRDEVFPFIKSMNGEKSHFAKHMKDAIFMIPTASLLDRVVNMIDQIDMDDRDTKGDVYEYMLGKMALAGSGGQFRTPRHIIRMMVEMTAPVLDGDKSDIICDPASGTCGFLMAAEEYVRNKYDAKITRLENKEHFNHKMFNAFDFDSSMLRIGAMNLMSHGLENPHVEYRDSLSDYGDQNIKDAYTLILANPPFKGSVAYDELSPDLLTALGKSPKKAATKKEEVDENGEVKTKKKGPSEKTELLFLALILRQLQAGGRAAVIIPEGVLFGSTKSHKTIRQTLVEKHKLQAVVSMPSGVFKPYAGVKTAILFFTKTGTGGTDNVWFYDMQAEGYSLDDKRTPLIAEDKEYAPEERHKLNNIPDAIARWQNLDAEKDRKRTEQSFFVSKDEIIANGWDLSLNRYKEVVYEEIQYDAPQDIIARIKQLQTDMQTGLEKLEAML